MRYRYRCGQCRAESPPVSTRQEAIAYRDHHRAVVHGGLAPDGEELGPEGPAVGTDYLSTRAVLIGLVLVALATAIARLLE